MGHSTALNGTIILKTDTPLDIIEFLIELFSQFVLDYTPDHPFFRNDKFTWMFGNGSEMVYIDAHYELRMVVANKGMHVVIEYFLNWIEQYTHDCVDLWIADENKWYAKYSFNNGHFVQGETEQRYEEYDEFWG